MTDKRDSAHVHFSRARLRGHLDGLGVSLDELAMRANLTPSLREQIDLGPHCQPDPEQIEAIATALGLQPADLHGTGEWSEEYIAAVVPHMPPMSPEDIDRAAAVLTRTGVWARDSDGAHEDPWNPSPEARAREAEDVARIETRRAAAGQGDVTVRQPTGAYARWASDADSMRIERLVDSARFEIEASRGSVSAGFSPEAREDLDALRELLVQTGLDRGVANRAVGRLILTRRPIFECIAAATAEDPAGD